MSKRDGLNSMTKTSRYHKYTPEEDRYLKEIIVGRSYAEVHRLFNERFGLALTRDQITGKIYRLGIKNGMDTRIGYGQINVNRKGRKNFNPEKAPPIGRERIRYDGCVEVKICHLARCHNWKAKHYIIWEAAHGPIPKGHVIMFADGNKRNFDLDNLLLISRAELGFMIRCGLIFPDRELTRTGKVIADIILLNKRREREARKKA